MIQRWEAEAGGSLGLAGQLALKKRQGPDKDSVLRREKKIKVHGSHAMTPEVVSGLHTSTYMQIHTCVHACISKYKTVHISYNCSGFSFLKPVIEGN